MTYETVKVTAGVSEHRHERVNHPKKESSVEKELRNMLRQYQGSRGKENRPSRIDAQRPQQGRSDASEKRVEKRFRSGSVLPWCENYNRVEGCTFPLSDDGVGCVRLDGIKKVHGCNSFVNGKRCDSKRHTRQNHPSG